MIYRTLIQAVFVTVVLSSPYNRRKCHHRSYAGGQTPSGPTPLPGMDPSYDGPSGPSGPPELPAILPGQVSPLNPSGQYHPDQSLAVGISSPGVGPSTPGQDLSLPGLGPSLPGLGPSPSGLGPPPPGVGPSPPGPSLPGLIPPPPGLGPSQPGLVPTPAIGSPPPYGTPPPCSTPPPYGTPAPPAGMNNAGGPMGTSPLQPGYDDNDSGLGGNNYPGNGGHPGSNGIAAVPSSYNPATDGPIPFGPGGPGPFGPGGQDPFGPGGQDPFGPGGPGPFGPGGQDPFGPGGQDPFGPGGPGTLDDMSPGTMGTPGFLDFMVVGDWGVTKTPDQQQVANAMKNAAVQTPPRFVVSVGDNFYPTPKSNYEGVNSAQDPKWTDSFDNIYNGNLQKVPFLSVLGNHDWLGNPTAQMDYSQLNPARWIMPTFFYERTFTIGKVEAAFIFIETNFLAYAYSTITNEITANFRAQGWPASENMIQQQLQWIFDAIQRHKNKKYTFVVGHHLAGTCKTEGNMTQLMTMFDSVQPTAYLFGHQHAMQSTSRGKTQYVQVGSSGKSEPVCDDNKGWGVGDTLGFVNARLGEEYGTLQFVGVSGNILNTIKV
ncbi:hypothetical protein BASA81_013895 [Batrachochytrium salamandrivorans]|nr:hypothetical protein BASA81_013895 [Batrachochytrium salamandrivorans]